MVGGPAVFIDRAPVVGGHQGKHLGLPETALLRPAVAGQPVGAQQHRGGLRGGIAVGAAPQAGLDLLEGAGGAGGLEGVGIDHLHRGLQLAGQQGALFRAQAGRRRRAGDRTEGLIQLRELPQVGAGLAVGLDALDRIHPGGDVGQHGEGHRQRHRGNRVEVALQPERAQRHVGAVENHQQQIQGRPQRHEAVPLAPQAAAAGGKSLVPAGPGHGRRDPAGVCLICLATLASAAGVP